MEGGSDSVQFKKLAQMVDIAESPLQAQVAVCSSPHQKIYNDSYQFIRMLVSSFHNAGIRWTDGYILFRKYYFFIQPFSLQSITLFQSLNSKTFVVKETHLTI